MYLYMYALIYGFIDLGVYQEDLWVIISTMVLCNAIDIARYDRRRSGLHSAPLVME